MHKTNNNKQGGFLHLKLIVLFVVVIGLGVLLVWKYVDSKAKLANTDSGQQSASGIITTASNKPELQDATPAEEPAQSEITSIKSQYSKVVVASSATTNSIRGNNMVAYAVKEAGRSDTYETPSDNHGSRISVYQGSGGCGAGSAWCAAFVTWVHKQATNNTNPTLSSCQVSKLMTQAGSYLRSYGQPASGNILTWYGKESNGSLAGHTGILVRIDSDGKYETIEGNGGSYDPSQKMSRVRYFTRAASYWRTHPDSTLTGIHTGFIIP